MFEYLIHSDIIALSWEVLQYSRYSSRGAQDTGYRMSRHRIIPYRNRTNDSTQHTAHSTSLMRCDAMRWCDAMWCDEMRWCVMIRCDEGCAYSTVVYIDWLSFANIPGYTLVIYSTVRESNRLRLSVSAMGVRAVSRIKQCTEQSRTTLDLISSNLFLFHCSSTQTQWTRCNPH